ncbi:MAG: hypothetical protein JXR22_07035, partial [Prolixibacteraceae bacterium]|nr:hypothetical protein [Prolixibacteraceae bacterium]
LGKVAETKQIFANQFHKTSLQTRQITYIRNIEIINNDGTMARFKDLMKFAEKHKPIILPAGSSFYSKDL